MSVAHDVLGVPPGAAEEEVRDAYRRLVLRYHPDRHAASPEAAAAPFLAVQCAYETLRPAAPTHTQTARHEPVLVAPRAGGAAGSAFGPAQWLPHGDERPRGWYADPYATGRWRYWDGAAWTGHASGTTAEVQPAPTEQPARRGVERIADVASLNVLAAELGAELVRGERIVELAWAVDDRWVTSSYGLLALTTRRLIYFDAKSEGGLLVSI